MDIDHLLRQLKEIEPTHLADVDKSIRVMDAGLRPVRLGLKLIGRAFTLEAREDFLTVMVALAEAKPGDVLVVDTRGSSRAVLGELFSLEAARRGLAGIIVDGPIRDVITIRGLDIPVYARHYTPLAGTTQKLYPIQQPVICGGVIVNPGDIVFGDDDGVIVVSEAELVRLLPTALEIAGREREAISRMQAGTSLLTMLNFEEHHANLRAGRGGALKFVL